MSDKPSRIVRLTAENIKRLKAVSVTPDGKAVIRVGGRNAQGKTSLMDCIAYALCGASAAPAEPVRRGEKKAQIILETDDLTVTRRFTAAGGTSLEVTNKEGLKYSGPQGVLDKLVSTLAFDPLAFCRADKKAQFAQLQELLGIDTATVDVKRAEAFARRTQKNRDVKALAAVVDSLPATGPARVDIRDLLDELGAAEQKNAAVDEMEREAMERDGILDRMRRELAKAEARVKELDALYALAREEAKRQAHAFGDAVEFSREFHAKLVIAERADLNPIKQRIAEVEQTNAAAAKVQERAAKQQELDVMEDEAKMMSEDIRRLDEERAAMLSGCKMPVPGIDFAADGVRLNGLPLEQASAAEQLKLGVAVACAMNPRMRVMLVRDGSLLDDDSMRMLEEMATAHDAQIWVERVGDDGKCTVVIEDGEALPHTATATAAVPEAALEESLY